LNQESVVLDYDGKTEFVEPDYTGGFSEAMVKAHELTIDLKNAGWDGSTIGESK
jgi:hypothetical protein